MQIGRSIIGLTGKRIADVPQQSSKKGKLNSNENNLTRIRPETIMTAPLS